MARKPKSKEPRYPAGAPGQYPNTIQIGDSVWELRIVRDGIFSGKGAAFGVCDPETRTIYLDMAQSRAEMFSTFVHELFHAIAFEYGLKIRHSLVHDLEVGVSKLWIDNAVALHRIIYGD